jgi:hypothetical protein
MVLKTQTHRFVHFVLKHNLIMKSILVDFYNYYATLIPIVEATARNVSISIYASA